LPSICYLPRESILNCAPRCWGKNVEDGINQEQQANPAITTAQLDAYFNGYYQGLLNNPAIAGLALQVHWDTLNPNPPGASTSYFWNYVDDAFAQAAAWDAQNPTQAPKTIQLIVTPDFQSPPWILNQIPSCDELFQTPSTTPPGPHWERVYRSDSWTSHPHPNAPFPAGPRNGVRIVIRIHFPRTGRLLSLIIVASGGKPFPLR
jgi:hypothetical protein